MVHRITSDRSYTIGSIDIPRLLERTTTSTGKYVIHLSVVLAEYHRWINIRIQMLGALFSASLAAYLVYGNNVRAANTGFSLNMAGL